MSNIQALITTVVLCSAPTLLRGQSDEATAREQVLATDERRITALRRGDLVPLQQIYADDYTLVTPAGIIYTKVDQLNDLASGRLRYEALEVAERSVRVYGDVVVLLSREHSTILRAGKQVGGDVRSTRVYKRFGTQWRVIATHASSIAQ
jgi:ketosteroid isomerase-like protein